MIRINEYAVYKGEGIISIGTVEEIAEELNIKKDTVRFYGTPSWIKRTTESARRLVKL